MIKKFFSFWLYAILYYILLLIIVILIGRAAPKFVSVIAFIGFFYCPYRAFKKARHIDEPKEEQPDFPTSDFIEKASTPNATQTSHTSSSNQKWMSSPLSPLSKLPYHLVLYRNQEIFQLPKSQIHLLPRRLVPFRRRHLQRQTYWILIRQRYNKSTIFQASI